MAEKKLTPKQERFVAEYLVDLNATQAAIRAGYSRKSAEKIARDLLRKTTVLEAVEKARLKLSIKTERTAVDVLRDIQAVTIEAREAGDHRAAFKGLELEGKHLGMFTDKVELSGAVDLSAELRKARERSGR